MEDNRLTIYDKRRTINEGGAVPVILIVAGVIITLAVLVTLWQLSGNKAKKASPSPAPALSSGCNDRDYTGCDGKEVFKWKDDGKR